MKKIIGTLLTIIFTVVLTFTSMVKVNAADNGTKVVFKSSRQIDGLSFQAAAKYKFMNAGTTIKVATITSNGKTIEVSAYCFNHALNAPTNNTNLIFNESATAYAAKQKEAAYVYVLDNGFGGNWNSKYGVGLTNDDDKYYVTQLAIWGILYQYDKTNGVNIEGETKDQNGNAINSRLQAIKTNAIKLRDDALKNTYTKPEIHLSDSSNGVMTETGNFYRTGTMKVTGYGYQSYKVEVSGANGAEIVDSKGTSHGTSTTFNARQDFYVRVPSSVVTTNGVSINTKVSATGTKRNLAIYYTTKKDKNGKDFQNIGIAYTTAIPVNANLTAKATMKKGNLKVTKVYLNAAGAESNLAGVTLQLIDSNNKVVKEWITDTKPMVIENLEPGTYTLHEVKAPEGYNIAADQKVTIVSGKTAEAKVINTKTIDVSISKQDATTGKELPGAKLVLKDSKGNVVDDWTSTDVPHIVKVKLAPGEYTLSETIAPEGYKLSTETVKFTVNDDGGVDEPVVMKNSPLKGVYISKQDVATSKELPGATLTLKDSKGKVIETWVSTKEPHYIANLEEGTYTLIEEKAPKGYGLSDEVITFTIKYDGKAAQKVVMYNSIIPDTGDINIPLIIVGLIGSVMIGIFGFTKLNKHA